MASRPIAAPYSVITNGSMAGNLTSLVSIIQNLSLMSYSVTWSGATPIGAVTVQVSNDYTQNGDGTVANAGTWNTLPLSATGTVSGNTGTGFIDITENAGYALRLVYTAASGTGVLNAIFTSKVA